MNRVADYKCHYSYRVTAELPVPNVAGVHLSPSLDRGSPPKSPRSSGDAPLCSAYDSHSQSACAAGAASTMVAAVPRVAANCAADCFTPCEHRATKSVFPCV